MKKVVCLNRRTGQLLVWDDMELTASFWGVIGLQKNDSGERYIIKTKHDKAINYIGSVSTDVEVQEQW